MQKLQIDNDVGITARNLPKLLDFALPKKILLEFEPIKPLSRGSSPSSPHT